MIPIVMTKNSGFTLIEVLVAVVIMALGLLGLAALETSALAGNQSAYNRSLATQLAYDIADRMRANAGAAINYESATTLPENAQCPNANNQLVCLACNSAANFCTAIQMAQKDLWEWNRSLAALPLSTGRIVNNGGIYTVTINWDDTKSGDAVNSGTSFQTSFRL